MSDEIGETLRRRLETLQPAALSVIDESHRHAGHAGARNGRHYKIDMVAAVFTGKNTLARHRLIYDAAGDLMHGPIHALSIRASTPEEI